MLIANLSANVFYLFQQMEFSITTQWDTTPTGHAPVDITLSEAEGGVTMSVRAPFFNDPAAPSTPSGSATWKLWDYEGTLNMLKVT